MSGARWMATLTLGLVFGMAACGGHVGVAGAGGGGGSTGVSGCPAAPPVPGAACTGADSALCLYEATPCLLGFICTAGAWAPVPNHCANVCPTAVPANGSPCSGEGLSCNYAEPACSTSTATCTGGSWSVQTFGVGCAAQCPSTLPADGDPCDMCCLPPSCDYTTPAGCKVVAACSTGTWSLSPCPPPTCSNYPTYAACAQDPGCRWLTPGCGMGTPFNAACFAASNCTGNGDCTGGQQCTQVDVDPCFMKGCNLCSGPASVCL